MAIDEAIFQSVSHRDSPPTLRIYSWWKPAITLGYFQKLHKNLVLQNIEDKGIEITRRITGGRAVFHWPLEITYSLSLPKEHKAFSMSISEACQWVSKAIELSLLHLGISVLPASRPNGKGKEKELSYSCFESASYSELIVDGKKLIGSAQYRSEDGILQQGSIPWEDGHKQLVYLLGLGEISNQNVKNCSCTALSDHMEVPPDPEKIREAFVKGFNKVFDCDLIYGLKSSKERSMAEELSKKYQNLSWIEKREGSR